MATGTDVVNAVIANTPILKANVPYATYATLQSTGGAIMQYEPFMNAFVDTLVNRILFQEVHNDVYTNPLALLFKGAEIPFGTDVQDSIANPAVATPYDSTALADILTPATPDVKTVYYRRNRQDKYKVTIYDEDLKGAFIGEGGFRRFSNMILNTLGSGDNIDEFRLMVGLLGKAADDGNIHTSTITGTTDEEKSTKLVKAARAKYMLFKFPSTAYNKYVDMAKAAGIADATPLTTWISEDRICIVIRADVAANTDVDVLAKAFNMNKADFLGRQVIVDSFGDGAVSSKMLAVVMDKTAIRAHDNLLKMAPTGYNAATLSRTYYLHHWETMAFSPFADAWAFIEQ